MRRKGFTLIELLVVIAIIGLLVSILVPSISRAQRMAKRAACQANLNGLGKSLAMYHTSNDSWPFISGNSERGAVPEGESYGRYLYMVFDSPKEYDRIMVDEDNGGWIFSLDGEPDEAVDLNMVENLNLLVKGSFIDNWRNFRDPQVSSLTMDRSDTTEEPMWGFIDQANRAYVEYAYHLGYYFAGTTNRNSNPARFSGRTKGNMVVLGDQHGTNSSGEDAVDDFGTANNPEGLGFSHGNEGINVVTASGVVNWSRTVKAGIDGNNVYVSDFVDGDVDIDMVPTANDIDRPSSRNDTVLIRINTDTGG